MGYIEKQRPSLQKHEKNLNNKRSGTHSFKTMCSIAKYEGDIPC